MNLIATLRALVRRWYIVIPGFLIAIAVAVTMWNVVQPTYERQATQLLLPGEASIPEAGNPYLYLGGLSQAADVVVTAMSSDEVLGPIVEDHPGAEVVVRRDPLTSGPQLLTSVTAKTDADAQTILDDTVAATVDELDRLQDVDGITARNRIGIKTITFDLSSTLNQKTRIMVVGASALGVIALTLVVAALVEGLGARRRRRVRADRAQAGEVAEESVMLESVSDDDDEPSSVSLEEETASLFDVDAANDTVADASHDDDRWVIDDDDEAREDGDRSESETTLRRKR